MKVERKKIKLLLLTSGILSLFFRVRIKLSNITLHSSNTFISLKNKVNSFGSGNAIYLSNNVDIRNCKIVFHGSNNTLKIKENTKLRNVSFVFEENDNNIYIGSDSEIYGPTLIATMESTEIKIGSECLFSSGLSIRTGDSHSIIDKDNKRINPSDSITIGKKVWIGSDVKVLKGVTIPNYTVVATNTVINDKFFEENTMIAGIVAKIKKRNINWLKEKV